MNFAFVAFVYALFVTWRKWEKEEEKIASLNLLNLLCNGLVFWLLPQCKGDDYSLNTFLDAIANYDYNFRSLVCIWFIISWNNLSNFWYYIWYVFGFWVIAVILYLLKIPLNLSCMDLLWNVYGSSEILILLSLISFNCGHQPFNKISYVLCGSSCLCQWELCFSL